MLSNNSLNSNQPQQQYNSQPGERLFIHPTHNGFIRIEDIKTYNFPNGLEMQNKWDFIPLDSIDINVLEKSRMYKMFLNKKKIEIVNEEYVKKNVHKSHKSPIDAAIDAILVKNSTPGSALHAAEMGGIHSDNNAIEVFVS